MSDRIYACYLESADATAGQSVDSLHFENTPVNAETHSSGILYVVSFAGLLENERKKS